MGSGPQCVTSHFKCRSRTLSHLSSPRLTSSSNKKGFSWISKFADGVSVVTWHICSVTLEFVRHLQTTVYQRSPAVTHDDVSAWKHFPHYCPFKWGIASRWWISLPEIPVKVTLIISRSPIKFNGATGTSPQWRTKQQEVAPDIHSDSSPSGDQQSHAMMTSSNGTIFRVTGPLCGEFTGHWWIPLTKAIHAEIWCFFLLCLNKRLSKQLWGWWFETPSCSLWRHCNAQLRMFVGWNYLFITWFKLIHVSKRSPMPTYLQKWKLNFDPKCMSCDFFAC